MSVHLAELTTMRVGGPAADLVTIDGDRDGATRIVEAVQAVDEAAEPLLVLGGGSNLVVADAGFPGTVVHLASRGVWVEARTERGVTVRVAAGHPWDEFVVQAVDEGWSGIEALSGIPGSAGATPVQNVGAYGQEVARYLTEVRVWDRLRRQRTSFTAGDCGFGYRTSRLKTEQLGPPDAVPGGPRYVVLDVVFHLELGTLSAPIGYADLADQLGVSVGQRVPAQLAREGVLAQRRRRGMVLDEADHDTWSCGSFFTNPVLDAEGYARLAERAARAHPDQIPPRFPGSPGSPASSGPAGSAGSAGFQGPPGGAAQVKTSAAWLIERAGFTKGYGLPGPAALSTKHCLAVTNRGNATAADVIALARTVRDGVYQTYGVQLVNEPVLVGCSLSGEPGVDPR